MWFDYTKTALKKLKVAYNSLRQCMGLPWHNSASEMFVNLNIKSFGEIIQCIAVNTKTREHGSQSSRKLKMAPVR